MSFLRYMTLFSASKIHEHVTLIMRDQVPEQPAWRERQDFHYRPARKNWMKQATVLPIKVMALEDIAPEIAELRVSDIHTSDILAWWLLSHYGGTVADMDIVFMRPLPKIKRDVQIVVFDGPPKEGYTPVSFMQGKPCKRWRDTYENALLRYDASVYESCGTKALTFTPKPTLSRYVVFPWAGRYKWGLWHHWMFGAKTWPRIPEECCGIHWYAGRNQKWNQLIKDASDLRDGAIPWTIKKVLSGEGFDS